MPLPSPVSPGSLVSPVSLLLPVHPPPHVPLLRAAPLLPLAQCDAHQLTVGHFERGKAVTSLNKADLASLLLP